MIGDQLLDNFTYKNEMNAFKNRVHEIINVIEWFESFYYKTYIFLYKIH